MSEVDKRPLETVKEWFRHADQNLAVAERELTLLKRAITPFAFCARARLKNI